MSFGQELKDFVGAMSATYKLSSDRRDKKRDYERALVNDEIDNEYKKANTEKVLKGNKWYDRIVENDLASSASTRAVQASQLKWADQLNQSLIDARKIDAYRTLNPVPKGGALPLGDGLAPEGSPEDYLDLSSYSAVPLPNVRRQQYAAEGGLIMDEEEMDEEVGPALPVEAPVPAQRPVAEPSAAEELNPRIVGFDKAHEAVMQGINYSLAQMGLNSGAAVQDPNRAARLANYLKGAGAAPQSLIKQAEQLVDPDGELSESERTMGTLGTVYNHYLSQGDAEKAKKAAASIVQYQRRLFSTYAAVAQAAAENGDVDNTVEAAIRAYAAIPDGRDMKVMKQKDGRYAVSIIDEATGETIQKPVLTPEEIGGWALKVQPNSFDEFIMSAAGERKTPSRQFQDLAAGIDEGNIPTNEQTANLDLEESNQLRARVKDAQEGAPPPVSYEQSNKTREDMLATWDELAGMEDEDGNRPYEAMAAIPAPQRKTMIDAASDIMVNPKNRGEVNLSSQDAIEMAGAVALAGPDSYKRQNKQGGVVVTLPDERQAWMPMARFRQLDNIYKAATRKSAGEARVNKARSDRDAAAAAQDMEETRARVQYNREELMNGDPWSNPYSGSALPLEVDKGGQAALDRLNELLGQ